MFLCLDQMYAEICAYLTGNKYFELPTYRVSDFVIDKFSKEFILFPQKSLVNFTVIFCLVIFVGMCLVGVGVVTHSDWKYEFSFCLSIVFDGLII